MGTTLDRMYLSDYLRKYLIVLVSLLSLYIIIDLFTNLDDFSGRGFRAMVLHIWKYYSVRVSQIFDRLSEAITLLAAVFTVGWMQRNNELLPQLSAGISTHRVLRPVLLGALATLALGPLNQEFVIPRIAEDLTIPRDDPELDKPAPVPGRYETGGTHLEGVYGFRKDQKIQYVFVTFLEAAGTRVIHLAADEAEYVPAGQPKEGFDEGWMLYRTSPPVIYDTLPPKLTMVSPGKYFLKTAELDFDAVTRGANYYLYASTPRLREILAHADSRRQSQVAVLFHTRLTRPLVGIVLVLLGLGRILRNQNQHVFISAGLCLVVSALFYVAIYGCKFLGENDYLSPALSAWMPVLIFGPIALAMFDAIHT